MVAHKKLLKCLRSHLQKFCSGKWEEGTSDPSDWARSVPMEDGEDAVREADLSRSSHEQASLEPSVLVQNLPPKRCMPRQLREKGKGKREREKEKERRKREKLKIKRPFIFRGVSLNRLSGDHVACGASACVCGWMNKRCHESQCNLFNCTAR